MNYFITKCKRNIHLIKRALPGIMAGAAILFLVWPLAAQQRSPSQVEQIYGTLLQQRDSVAYVDVLSEIGMLYHMINRDSCLLYALKIQDISERIHYEKGMANSLNLLGICHALKGNFKLAVEYGFQALQKYRAVGDSANTSQVLNNLCVYYANYTTDKKAEAYGYLQEAMKVASQLKPPEDSFYSLVLMNYIGFFGEDTTKQDSVKWAIAKSREILAKYPLSRFAFYMDLTIADSLMKAGQGKEAELMINKLAASALDKGLAYVAIEMYERMDLYRSMGYHSNAVYYWEKMYELGKQAGYNDLQMTTLANLYTHYSTEKDQFKMNYYSNEIMQLSSGVLEVEKQSGVKYIDFFLKEQDKNELRVKTALQLQRIEKNDYEEESNRLLLTYVGILLGLMIVWYIRQRYYYRSQKKKNTVLEQLHADLYSKQLQLEINDTFKNKLITIIANDFRAPLTHITKVADLLRTRSMNQDDMMLVIDQIAVSSEKTLLIFDSILRWIKSQLSGFVFVPQSCTPHLMLGVVLQDMEEVIKERQLKIFNRVPVALQVSADPEMLQFVHRHLLSAIIARAVAGSMITIIAERAEELVTLYFTFIPMEHLGASTHHLFDTDDISDEAEVQQSDTGLILVICRDFMVKMKGDVSIAESEGGRVSFVYTLPVLT